MRMLKEGRTRLIGGDVGGTFTDVVAIDGNQMLVTIL
jgi:N-methylhydantoinase A/oxoprolinase/acetone carboxylase beta subunit